MDEVVVRLIRADDSIPRLTALLHAAYRPLAEMGLRFLASHQDDQMTRKRIGNGECFVALCGTELVGTVLFRSAERTSGCPWYDRPEVASFSQLAVAPAHQFRGLGARLLEVVESRAVETGASELALDTAEGASQLIRMYRRAGFRIVGTAQWDVTNYRSIVLSKRLR